MDNVKDLIGLRFIPCHRIPSRSPRLFGRQFPLCYRCLFIILGYLFVPFFVVMELRLPLWFGVMLNIPMLVDGITQARKWRFSNNGLRMMTGLMSGIGQSIVVVDIMKWLTILLLKI